MVYTWAVDTRLNTYAVKDRLKAIGCRWNAEQKAWMARDEAMWRQAMAIAEEAGPAPEPKAKAYRSRRPRDGDPDYMGGRSYYDRNGNFVLGDDD